MPDLFLRPCSVQGALAECDFGCPIGIGHYTRGVGDSVVDFKGHPIVRAASTLYPVLKMFLAYVTDARVLTGC